jgi:hypothetical protein
MYRKHPSVKLNELFQEKPFQGVSPESANFLFIGLDANYNEQIESQQIFDKVVEYHSDGVNFWQKYKVHHPFLLDDYKGDGRKYHKNFARIGFQDKDANLISFIELLHLPTVGRNKLSVSDLSASHLKKINECILEGSAEFIFLSSGVANLVRKSEQFAWLPKKVMNHYGNLGILWQDKNKFIFSHLHFSNYGKFEKQMLMEAQTIRELKEDGKKD